MKKLGILLIFLASLCFHPTFAEAQIIRDNCTTLPGPTNGTVCSQRTTAGGFLAGSIVKYFGASWKLVGSTEKRRYPAAGCTPDSTGTIVPASIWDLRATGAATPVCVGSNVFKGVLNFPDTSGGFAAEMHDILPVDWTTTGGMDFAIYWATPAIAGNGKWTIQIVCTPVNASLTDDPPYPTSGSGFNIITTAAPSPASRVQTSSITGLTLPASCPQQTALLIHFRLFTDGGDVADTLGQLKSMIFSELTYRRM